MEIIALPFLTRRVDYTLLGAVPLTPLASPPNPSPWKSARHRGLGRRTRPRTQSSVYSPNVLPKRSIICHREPCWLHESTVEIRSATRARASGPGVCQDQECSHVVRTVPWSAIAPCTGTGSATHVVPNPRCLPGVSRPPHRHIHPTKPRRDL